MVETKESSCEKPRNMQKERKLRGGQAMVEGSGKEVIDGIDALSVDIPIWTGAMARA
jgi:hypothetical protein